MVLVGVCEMSETEFETLKYSGVLLGSQLKNKNVKNGFQSAQLLGWKMFKSSTAKQEMLGF